MTEKNTKLSKYTFDAEEVSKSFAPYRTKKEEVEKKLLEIEIKDEITLNAAQTTFNRGRSCTAIFKKLSNFMLS